MTNRLGIYFFFDKDGIVGDYVTYYLEHIKPFCSELCVVVNEPLSIEGRKKLEKCCDTLLVRENFGFDSQAYKYAIEHYGYDKLKEYDELLLCNFTCYGPVYPFSEMFDEMAKRDCDFWGSGWYPRRDNLKVCEKQVTDYMPEHIMSFFMIIRNNMLSSNAFVSYWKNIQVPTTYAEAVAFNELVFTDYFSNKGFKGDTYISRQVSTKFKENIFAFSPIYALEKRFPLVKRTIFKSDYSLQIYFGRGNQAIGTIEYLSENTDYDLNLIWDDLLRTQKGSTIKRALHLNYFLDENYYNGNEENLKNNLRTAMLCYCYYPDMLDYCKKYASNLPEWVDIYLFVVDENLVNTAKKVFEELPNKTEIRVKENRGQLASAVLISGKDIFEKYDLVCVSQAKKTSQLRDQFASENFCDHCWEGILKSKAYVLNLIQAYYDNPRMGYSCNFIPHWDAFSSLPSNETLNNDNNIKKLMKELDINVPFDEEPVASFGECYWVRANGYKKLLAHNWKHGDFPPANETPKDGGILNALERLMPLVVQEQGYYSAWIIPQTYASVYFDNIYYRWIQLIRHFNQVIEQNNKTTISCLFASVLNYIRCRFLQNITFGKKRHHYRFKKYRLKRELGIR